MKDERFSSLTLLCVEDEAGVRRRLVNTLAFYFHKVYEADNGATALGLIEEHRPDVILCDIDMPVMDGIALVRHIRKEDFSTPIVMLTAYAQEEYLLELVNLHIHHYILKPVNSERLLEGLEAALRGKIAGRIRVCEGLVLDLGRKSVLWHNNEISLSRREVVFLSLLVNHDHHVVRYATLEERLWNDKPMSQDALKSFVRDLRKKIPVDIVENVSQLGYRLCCEKK
ncbi:MAG: response regulator [Campylobacterales bacterium]|nr:response regulator [Campylobacterales bacterium]